MAEPSKNTTGTALANAAQFAQALSAAARTASTGAIATMETLRDSLSGRIMGPAAGSVDNLRAAVASALSKATSRQHVELILRQLALAYELDSAQEGTVEEVMTDLYDSLTANTHHVKQRALVYGTPAAGGSNVGNGTCVRLTLDEGAGSSADGQELQGWFADDFTLECVADQTSGGQTLRETFRLRGTDESPDLLQRDGYGPLLETGIPVASADYTKRSGTLTNPGFDQVTLDGSTLTGVTGWTPVSAIGNYETNTTATYIYLDSTNGGTARSLKQTADDTIYQELVSTARARLRRDTPYLIGIRVYRLGAATGNLTLRLSDSATSGGISRTVTLASLTQDDFTTVYLVASPNEDCWLQNFNANTLKFSITIDTLAVGTVHFSDVIFSPFTRVGALGDTRTGRGAMGTYLAVVSGTTPFLRQDSFSWSDTEVEADRGEIAFWLASWGLGYLPSVDDATQVTAAGGRTFTFADADPDTITLSTGDLTTEGYAQGMTLTVAGTSNNDGTYKIASVTATVITLEAGEALTAEGPLSATATLDASAYYPDA